jgi:hypothetical protein
MSAMLTSVPIHIPPRRIRALAAVVVATAAAAPAAHAATYSARFEGVYHLNAQEADPDGVMNATRTVDIGWNSVTASDLTLSPGSTAQASVAPTQPPVASLDAAYHAVFASEPPTTQDCTGALQGAPTPGLAGATTDDQGMVTVDFTPFDQVTAHFTCSRAIPAPDEPFAGSGFEARAVFPASRIGEGQIVVAVQNDPSLPCPSFDAVACAVSWSGQITLTRTDYAPPSPGPVPAPGPAPAPRPTPKPKPRPRMLTLPELQQVADDGFEIPALVDPGLPRNPPTPRTPGWEVSTTSPPAIGPERWVRWDAREQTLSLWAACDGGCQAVYQTLGPVIIDDAVRAGAARATPRRAPHPTRFEVPAGSRPHRLRLRVAPADRAALRRWGHGVIAIALQDRRSGKVRGLRVRVRVPAGR